MSFKAGEQMSGTGSYGAATTNALINWVNSALAAGGGKMTIAGGGFWVEGGKTGTAMDIVNGEVVEITTWERSVWVSMQSSGGNVYETGNYSDTYYSTHGFPHLTVLQGAFRVDASYSVYNDLSGKSRIKFGGTVQHYSQALGESLFIAKTQLLVNGKPYGAQQIAGFGPGQSMITSPNVAALGFTDIGLPQYGANIQLQLTINAYFRDGQHPGVDITTRNFTFNVPFVSIPTIGPK